MNRRFKYDHYEFCTSFTTQNALSITVEDLNTGEYFLNDSVQLMRIKKDTVFATLERKSEKNLKCEINQHVDGGKRILVLEFVVAFDYLPQFRENIVLELVEKPAKLRTVSNTNFRVEVEQMEKILENIDQCKLISQCEVTTYNLTSNKAEIFSQELNIGKYMLQVSGIFTNNTGANTTERQVFQISIPGQEKYNTGCVMYSNSGYSYPFNFSEVLDVSPSGKVSVIAQQKHNITLTNVNVTLTPLVEMN